MTKILAIDDQKDNLITLKAVLKSLKPEYQFLSAISGLDGIAVAQQEKPDCILLDIIMPQMDGYEVCRLLKENELTLHIPIIMLTAIKSESTNRIKALELGADAFLSKPIDPDELMAQLGVMLRIKAAEDELRNEKKIIEKEVETRTKSLIKANKQLALEIEHRKKIEKELIEKEEQSTSIVSTAMDSFMIVDKKGLIIYLNNAAFKILGYSYGDIGRLSLNEIEGNQNSEEIQRNIEYIKKVGFHRFESTQKTKAGLLLDIEVSARWIPKLEQFYVFIHDITERKRDAARMKMLLEMHIASKQMSLQQLNNYTLGNAVQLTKSEIGFFHELANDQENIISTSWNIEELSNCKTNATGLYESSDAAIWTNCVRLGKPILNNNYKSSSKEKEVSDGHVLLHNFMTIPVYEDKLVRYIFGVGNKKSDYTKKDLDQLQIIANELSKIIKQRKSDQIIKNNEERYRSLYNHSPLPYQSLNEEGEFLDVNPAWLNTLGYTRDEIIGQYYVDFIHPDWKAHFQNSFHGFRKAGFIEDIEFKIKHKSDYYIDISLNGRIGHNTDGTFKQTYCVFQDVTERNKMHQELLTALEKAKESDRLKSSFLASMSHELRTPLNAIIGFSDMIDEEMELEEIITYNKIINTSGNQLLSIIRELFDISLIEAGEMQAKPEPCKIEDIIFEVENTTTAERKNLNKEYLTLLTSTTEELNRKTINTDKYKLVQILTNLTKNALKFTDKGSIEFGCRMTNDEDKRIEFYVKDTGIGIKQDKIDVIFDAFRQADDSNTRRHDGVGLGLTISKRLTELLGGELKIHTESNSGTHFWFALPVEMD